MIKMKTYTNISHLILRRGFVILIVCLLISFNGITQNVGINATGSQPNSSAGLDVDFSNKGLLSPRVALTSTSSFAPLAAHVAGMMVYNTATAGDLTPGFYYNNGIAWVRVGSSGESDLDWTISGNNMYSAVSGNVGVGTNTPASKLTVNGTIESTSGGIKFPDGTTQTSAASGKSEFRVTKNDIDQSINSGVAVKIQWAAKEFDTNNDFDLSNNQFKPKIAGKYLLNLNASMGNLGVGQYLMVYIYKNGQLYSTTHIYAPGASATIRVSLTDIANADGINDYFEAYVYQNSGSAKNLSGSSANTSMSGTLL